MNKDRKIVETEYDSRFEDYRDIYQEDKIKHNNDELSKITAHIKLN